MSKKSKLPDDWEDNPEWTDEDLARAKPFKEVLPKIYANWERNRGGRPPVKEPKVLIGFRLAQDVVSRVRASGRGYNARVEKVLREALEAGKF